MLASSSLPGVTYFRICSLEPVIYTFIVKFCQGNMNTVRKKSGKCQGILKKPVAMNPEDAQYHEVDCYLKWPCSM